MCRSPLLDNPVSTTELLCLSATATYLHSLSQVIFSVDIRAPIDDLRETAVKDVTEAIYTICIRRGVKCEVKRKVRIALHSKDHCGAARENFRAEHR